MDSSGCFSLGEDVRAAAEAATSTERAPTPPIKDDGVFEDSISTARWNPLSCRLPGEPEPGYRGVGRRRPAGQSRTQDQGGSIVDRQNGQARQRRQEHSPTSSRLGPHHCSVCQEKTSRLGARSTAARKLADISGRTTSVVEHLPRTAVGMAATKRAFPEQMKACTMQSDTASMTSSEAEVLD
ncbi:hypothetical protein F4821DRAFT_207608 [Hypoxylon rubiginosum]|uniref:Uncharacterized protein n=1 Tax=Hypoxylon rubiginosum TaxID=110542 RepID=A0ACC0CQI3_9PEZI|nr:hypothetical protein F4821DRAFT_207608 [Hypoxylon rubiginosum]